MAITHDKDLSDRYLWRRRLQWGGREIPRNPPGTRNIGDKSVISRKSRERRLGPPETVYVKGLGKLTITAAVMS